MAFNARVLNGIGVLVAVVDPSRALPPAKVRALIDFVVAAAR